MGTMQKPWPSPSEAISLDLEDFALRIVDRLDSTPNPGILLSRKGFMRRETALAESARRGDPNEIRAIRSENAVGENQGLARAYGEAWDFAVGQGWLAEDPVRSGCVYVTRAALKRLAAYRNESVSPVRRQGSEAVAAAGTGEESGDQAATPARRVSGPSPENPAVRSEDISGESGKPPAESPPAHTRPSGSEGPKEKPVRVFVSWAHAHKSHDAADVEAWTEMVATFVMELRRLGIDADIDLFHQHDDDVDWSTFGVEGIEEADYVFIVGSATYKDRWEGKGSPTSGAGAAREANALKSLFDKDRKEFLRRVKLILLPGVEVSDLPLELQSAFQRFRITTIDEPGITGLLRTLTGSQIYVKPPVGQIPPLPPKFTAGVEAANRGGEPGAEGGDAGIGQSVADQLMHRLEAVEKLLTQGAADDRSQELQIEQASIEGALKSLREQQRSNLSEVAPAEAHGGEAEEQKLVDEAKAKIERAAVLMRALPPVVREAIFQQFFDGSPLVVSGWGDTRFSLDDAREAEENGFLEIEDAETATFVPRSAKRAVSKAVDAVEQARRALCEGSMYDSTMAESLVEALDDEYDLDDIGFAVRTTWRAFRFL